MDSLQEENKNLREELAPLREALANTQSLLAHQQREMEALELRLKRLEQSSSREGCGENNYPQNTDALWISDSITHLETNLDDTTGENLAFVVELLLNNGAIDAWVTPIIMKKGRPAHTLHCLCKSGCVQHEETTKLLMELIFRYTTTLGIRVYKDIPRAKLLRSIISVQTPYRETSRSGFVDVKVSKFKNGEIVSMKAGTIRFGSDCFS